MAERWNTQRILLRPVWQVESILPPSCHWLIVARRGRGKEPWDTADYRADHYRRAGVADRLRLCPPLADRTGLELRWRHTLWQERVGDGGSTRLEVGAEAEILALCCPGLLLVLPPTRRPPAHSALVAPLLVSLNGRAEPRCRSSALPFAFGAQPTVACLPHASSFGHPPTFGMTHGCLTSGL